jgi:thiosulfate dehydrogenase [quinone] large subunit
MASNQTVLGIVDFMNIWGLILIGLGLIFGLFSRIAAISGVVLLSLYYIAIPPLIGYTGGMPTEGNYLIVDKNLVELFSLVILALFPTGKLWGLDRVIAQVRAKKAVSTDREETPVEDEKIGGQHTENPVK